MQISEKLCSHSVTRSNNTIHKQTHFALEQTKNGNSKWPKNGFDKKENRGKVVWVRFIVCNFWCGVKLAIFQRSIILHRARHHTRSFAHSTHSHSYEIAIRRFIFRLEIIPVKHYNAKYTAEQYWSSDWMGCGQRFRWQNVLYRPCQQENHMDWSQRQVCVHHFLCFYHFFLFLSIIVTTCLDLYLFLTAFSGNCSV